jgi:diaminopimelate epimerase
LKILQFYKYQGTGNDFVLVNDLENKLNFNQAQIAKICHRRFGIGADGFILLRSHPKYDFEMQYYNSDGRISSMCGNGGRCIARFAHDMGLKNKQLHFLAVDGPHLAEVKPTQVALKMSDVNEVETASKGWFVNTGSPHYVAFAEAPEDLDLLPLARAIRYSDTYQAEGVNVNFMAWRNGALHMRTYERGVEDETYSCGTGVTAAALVAAAAGKLKENKVAVHTKGGVLNLSFERLEKGYNNIWLTGPAEFVFKGELTL